MLLQDSLMNLVEEAAQNYSVQRGGLIGKCEAVCVSATETSLPQMLSINVADALISRTIKPDNLSL